MKKLDARILIVLFLIGFSGFPALADVFDEPIPECFKVSKIIDGKIFVLNSESQEEILDLSETNPRRAQIIQKAQEAVSSKKLLCGSVRGISLRNGESEPKKELSGQELAEFCEDRGDAFKASKGWTGMLSPKQAAEVEDFKAKCILAKGVDGNSLDTQEDKLERYRSCQDSAVKAQLSCESSADPKSCVINYLGKLKETFKNESDFAVMSGVSASKITVQCRIDGKAPSRRELDAPTRSTSPKKEVTAEGVR